MIREILEKKLTRRSALSTAGKVAIGAAAAAIIAGGGTAAYFASQPAMASTTTATTTATSVSTATTTATAVSTATTTATSVITSTVSASSSPAPSNSIPLGFIAPLTGPAYYGGATMLQGAQMAVNMINKAGGVLGKPINLIVLDEQGDPAVAKSGVTQMIEQQNIVALTGEYFSYVALAYTDVVAQAGIPFCDAGTSSDKLRVTEQPNHFFYSPPFCESAVSGINNAIQLFQMGKIKNVQAIRMTDEASANMWGHISASFDKVGLPYKSDVVDLNATDFTSLILGYKSATPRAEMLLTSVNGKAQFLIAKQAHDAGYAATKETPYVFELNPQSSNVTTDELWSTAGPGYQYWTLSNLGLPLKYLKPSQLGQQLITSYQALYNTGPVITTFFAFDAVWSWAQAATAAGTTDPKAVIQALSKQNIPGTLWQLNFPQNVPEKCMWQTPNIPLGSNQYQQVGQSWDDSPLVFPPEVATAPLLGPDPSDTVDFEGTTLSTTVLA